MLNIGPPELLLIIVIALVVVGPQRLPDLGRTIGRGLREFRKVQDEVRDMVDTGMGEDFKQTTAELRKTAADLRGATDVTSAFRNTPHKARQRAAEAVRAATTPDDDAPGTRSEHHRGIAEPSIGGADHRTDADPSSNLSAEPERIRPRRRTADGARRPDARHLPVPTPLRGGADGQHDRDGAPRGAPSPAHRCRHRGGVSGHRGVVPLRPVKELLTRAVLSVRHRHPDLAAGRGLPTWYFSGPIDGLVVKLKMVASWRLVVALPIVLYQLWAFIVPGLTAKEKKWSVPFVVSAIRAVPDGRGVRLRHACRRRWTSFWGSRARASCRSITFDRYVGFVTLVTLAFGLSFLFPVVSGVPRGRRRPVDRASCRDWRRWAILGIAIFAAVITPSSDPYTMLAMMIPMYLFYEGSIIIGRMMKR